MIFKLRQREKRDLERWHRHFVVCRTIESNLVIFEKVWRQGHWVCNPTRGSWMVFVYSVLAFDLLPDTPPSVPRITPRK